MSHENSAPAIQRELASEYRRHVKTNSNNGFMGILLKVLVIPLFAILILLTGASFAIANLSPAMYTKAKDIIFEKVDFEKITGQTESVNREYLDSFLILNPEEQQGEQLAQDALAQEEPAQGEIAREEPAQGEQIETPVK